MHRSSLALAAGLALAALRPAAAQQSLDQHFLDSTEFFIAAHEPGAGSWMGVGLARMIAGPTDATRGEAQFLVVGSGGDYENGQRVWTRWYWRTRPATPQDVALGATVFCLNTTGEGGVYRAPRNRQEALNTSWWMTIITDVSDVNRQQQVRAGSYVLATSCLRVSISGTPLSTGVASGPAAFDRHYLDSAEYFVAPRPLEGTWAAVAVGRMLQAASPSTRGEAQFLIVGAGADYEVGQRVWTSHYWKTRPATPEEATVGRAVFCLNVTGDESVYRPPRERSEALNGGWWYTTITDVSDLFRQYVTAGDYRLGLGCLRVQR